MQQRILLRPVDLSVRRLVLPNIRVKTLYPHLMIETGLLSSYSLIFPEEIINYFEGSPLLCPEQRLLLE